MKFNKSHLVGFAAGIFLTLGLVLGVQVFRQAPRDEMMAEVGNEKLTRKELRERVAEQLIPVENDRYLVLREGIDDWLRERLFEKEAKAEGMTLEEFYQKKIWSQVKITDKKILKYYQKNQSLFTQSLEEARPLIAQELRRKEYGQAKNRFVKELREKYEAKVYLKKPKFYVKGVGLARGTEGVPSKVPSITGGGALESKSVPGTAPTRGPAGARITLTEFSDFHCPFCKRVTPALAKVLENYPGKVQWVFRHYPLSTTPGAGSFLTHEASVCAQEQGKFWEFHDEIFSLASAPQAADLNQIAQKIGLNSEKFQECLKSGRHRDFLQKELDEGNKRGVQGTPTVFVNDQLVAGAYPYEHFVQVIKGILNPGKVAPPGAPPQVKEHGGAALPIPSVVQFDDIKGRPSLGPNDARVTLVEFSDFHCPFCKRVTPTIEELTKNYKGKIRRVWRHFPLSIHAGADRTHEASECAHEEGKFWEYQHRIFETQGGPRDDAALTQLAKQVGLNGKKFEKCLKSGKYRELIQKEIAAGNQAGVRGTPAFFVNGKLLSGAQPYESFDRAVQSELSKS